MEPFQASKANGKPPNPYPYISPPWRVALIANLKDSYIRQHFDPPDAGAEFDRLETLEALASALEQDGHWVHLCLADHTLPEALIKIRPQICFNIAEGFRGNGREAQVPALCELLGIPYTASEVVANAISLDKSQTKRIWREFGLPTAAFQEIAKIEDTLPTALRFPLFVKPAREGTGMGIDGGAIVRNETELVKRVEWVLKNYRQPALVEEYLPGREFTVGFIGNPGNPANRRQPELYDEAGYHWLPILEIDTQASLSPGVYGHDNKDITPGDSGSPDYLCPADIPAELQTRLIDLARRAAQALNVNDVGRIDFRLDVDGEPCLLEINTLPGLNPLVSDLCLMAAAEGLSYHTLITEILYLAAERNGLPLHAAEISQHIPQTAFFNQSYKASHAVLSQRQV